MSKTYMQWGMVLACLAALLPGRADGQGSRVGAGAARQVVRFAASGRGQLLRLRVFTMGGEEVFDSGLTSTPMMEWNRVGNNGQVVGDGRYLVVMAGRDETGQEVETTEELVLGEEGEQAETNGETPQLPAREIAGVGTIGRIAKWIAVDTVGNSAMTESLGRIGLGTAAPTSVLHVAGVQPAAVAGNGATAASVLQVFGGKGGNTTAAGFTGGRGASLILSGGPGGNAVGGSTNGTGGALTVQGGAAGTGGAGGARGNVLLNPSGGNVGIGTLTPLQKLSVAGMVQSTLGGFRFPDNTTQTTAGLAGVAHDGTLAGSGTAGSPLMFSTGFGDGRYARLGAANFFTGNQTVSGNVRAGGVVAASAFLSSSPGNPVVLGDSSANVGIGTGSTGLARLTVKGKASFTATGTITVTNGSTSVTGSGTKFLTELAIGDRILVPGSGAVVTAIASDTSLTTASNFTVDASGVVATISPAVLRLVSAFDETRLTLLDNGNVGIGAPAPGARLGILTSDSSADGTNTAIRLNNTAAGGGNWYLRAGATGTNTPAGGFSISQGTTSYRLSIDAAGQVGIGTAAPAAQLHVASGDVYVANAGSGVILKSPSGSVCARISLSDGGALVTTPLACP